MSKKINASKSKYSKSIPKKENEDVEKFNEDEEDFTHDDFDEELPEENEAQEKVRNHLRSNVCLVMFGGKKDY